MVLSNLSDAVNDFKRARQKADIEGILARLGGRTTELLSYEEVRQKLRAFESNKTVLRNIPLDAIVGSVGRNKDFSRSFLPLFDEDRDRWAGVMKATASPSGLPPIDVYQIGEVFFVLDGNHRVSVARELGAKSIQAFVREVRTRVNLTPDIKPDNLIIKVEELDFFERTQLDKYKPETDFSTTLPGQYPALLEHIEVHRYFMGLDEKRDISYEEAVIHWHETVYMPIVQLIRERGVLQHFPERTEVELYLWISSHRAELEENLDWQVAPESAIGDLAYHFSPEVSQRFSRLFSTIYDMVIPDPLESGPEPGQWRAGMEKRLEKDDLFLNILTLVSSNDPDWLALEQSIILAKQETAQIQGLHVTKTKAEAESEASQALKTAFESRCQTVGVNGTLAITFGSVARIACERSNWTDIIVTKVTFPPGDDPIARFASGLRTMIRRCPRPMLVVRDQISPLQHALLAYNGTPKAKEALYLSAYMVGQWHIKLSVLVIEHAETEADDVHKEAQEYLTQRGLEADFIRRDADTGTRSDIILETANQQSCDFILMGGYKSSSIVEVFLGSVVDAVLRKTEIPLLICR